MTFSKFEKYAAGKIKSHVSEVDAEALWNDVLPQVQNGKKGRRGLIWFFFIGLLASFAAIYALNENGQPDSDVNLSAIPSAIWEKGNATATKTQNIEKESEKLTKKEIYKENETKQNTLVEDTQNIDNQELIEQLNTKNTQKKYKVTTTNHANNKKPKSIEKPLAASKTIPEKGTNHENTIPAIALKDEDSETIDLQEIEILEEATPTDNANDELVVAEEKVEQLEETNSLTIEEEKEEGLGGNYNSGRSNFKLKYGFGLYGGYSSSFGSLSNKIEDDADYLKLRLETEEQLETIRLGVEAIVQTKVGVYLKTGAQYSRIARKFSLNSSIETVDSVYGVQKIYVNNNTMDTIYIYGQIPVTTTTTYNKVTYNYFHLMDIPILVGYNYLSDNNDWSFGVEAGAMINISTKAKGDILSNDPVNDPIYDIKEDRLDWFKDNVGVSFTASVNIGYFLNENFMIYVAPTARLESVFSTKANPISQKHGDLGINLGARYFIGN